VKHQRAGFQRFFEFFMAECDCLVVVVRTYNFEIQVIAHEPPTVCELSRLRLTARHAAWRPINNPAVRNPLVRSIRAVLSVLDGNACERLCDPNFQPVGATLAPGLRSIAFAPYASKMDGTTGIGA
jgi:hypothetical protein